MPGGFHGSETAIGAVKPGFRLATTFSSIAPPRTSGTFGSIASIENGASSVTATARESTVRVQNGTLFWPSTSSAVEANSLGISSLGVDGPAGDRGQGRRHRGVRRRAVKSTGTTSVPAPDRVGLERHPCGKPRGRTESARPPKSARAALIRIA